MDRNTRRERNIADVHPVHHNTPGRDTILHLLRQQKIDVLPVRCLLDFRVTQPQTSITTLVQA